jgi:uracil-DNA glycosylase family 4
MTLESQLAVLEERITACKLCPRLVMYREAVAITKRRAFRGETYWGRPVPGFGDPRAELVILGLAPAAHGANRTGRMFTGDRSGDFLYARLFEAGFASQPVSRHAGDGLQLRGAFITAAARCAPPDNKPLPSEVANCRQYLVGELELLRPRAVLALGKIAFDGFLKMLLDCGKISSRSAYAFRHGASYRLPGHPASGARDAASSSEADGLAAPALQLFAAYHPSQQNTQTGLVTPEMYRQVLANIRLHLSSAAKST